MQAVILAAGRGARMRELTAALPKPLLPVAGKPLIEHTLTGLATAVSEVVVVLGYRGEQIRQRYGSRFSGMGITYIEQGARTGTAGALWSAKPAMREERFLVLNGDDLYDPRELEKILRQRIAFGLAKKAAWSERTVAIELARGTITGWHIEAAREGAREVPVATGAYMLDSRIFSYEPVRITKGEYGLPHTILRMAQDVAVRGVFMERWCQVNHPHDLASAEAHLKNG
jgi:bifunctional UDP-N-acetylglucosamine pyrophosphorylase/glucosamine-1-phosphate N-acetyltransferase